MIRLINFEIIRILRSRKSLLFIAGLCVSIMLSLPSLNSHYSIMNFNGYTGVRNATWISTLSVLIASAYLIVFGFYFLKGYFRKDIKTQKYQYFKSSSTFFRIVLNKTIALFVFGVILHFVLIAVIIIMQYVSGNIYSFNLPYLLTLIIRYTFPTIIFVCMSTLMFDLIPVLDTKVGGFFYIFVFVNILLNESKGNCVQFSPLFSMAAQMSKVSEGSVSNYSVITNKSAVSYIELLPLKVHFSESLLFGLLLCLILLGLIAFISRFWDYSTKEKRIFLKTAHVKNLSETPSITSYNTHNKKAVSFCFAHTTNVLNPVNQILHIARVELQLLFSRCKSSIIGLIIIYCFWLIQGGSMIRIAPLIFPIFMLPSLMFLIEYPKLYNAQDFLSSTGLKQLNKKIRVFLMSVYFVLYVTLVVRANMVYFDFFHSLLLASTGALLLLSIATIFMYSKRNYFEGLFLSLWYLGILNKVPYFDIFFGANSTGILNQTLFNGLLLFIIIAISTLRLSRANTMSPYVKTRN